MSIPLLRLYTDGGSRGNPGPAAIGAVLYSVTGDKEVLLAEISEYIGETTNNQAEYRALGAALRRAQEFEPKKLEICMDSELIVKQLQGEYRVKDVNLAQRFLEIHNLLQAFPAHSVRHVRRAQNAVADRLVNAALDRELE